MAVTLQEIADKIGVSKMTVSRVLNGKTRGQVSAELTAKIQTALSECAYKPNMYARNLRSARNIAPKQYSEADCITILLPCPDFLDRSTDVTSEYLDIFNSVLQCASKHNCTIKMVPVSKTNSLHDIEWAWLKNLNEGSRILAYSAWFLPVLTELNRRGCRIAMVSPEIFWRSAYESIIRDWALFTCMTVDGSMQLTQYLADEGYTKIAIASGYPDEPDQPLVCGYNNVMNKNNNSYRNIIRLAGDTETSFAAIREAFEKNPFDSLILEYSRFWQINYRNSIQQNIGLPQEIKIVFRENLNACEYFHPQITSIIYPRKKIGTDAAEALLADNFIPGEKFYKGKLKIR